MFTGLVKYIGTIQRIMRKRSGLLLTINHNFAPLPAIGDSIAVNGCCLTVENINVHTFDASAVYETVKRTTLGKLKKNDKVNMELALRAGDRMGGHIVQGHVDTVGKIIRLFPKSLGYILTIRFPAEYKKYIINEGSIAIDGISLTVKNVHGNTFEVAVIPETYKSTILNSKRIGEDVNLEFDVLGKYAINSLIGR